MLIAIATDADWIVDEVTAALGGPDVTFLVIRDGHAVARVIAERAPDVVITDLQVGTMGGMAIAMSLRLDESAGTLPHVPIVMLLDRAPDVYLAQRSGAEAWLVKPLDALRLQRAASAALEGRTFHEGVPNEAATEAEPATETAQTGETVDEVQAEEDPVSAG